MIRVGREREREGEEVEEEQEAKEENGVKKLHYRQRGRRT